jgi:hypothetical protein
MLHRRLLPVGEVLGQLTMGDGYLPIYQRALGEALQA